jgi:hypothetical protein
LDGASEEKLYRFRTAFRLRPPAAAHTLQSGSLHQERFIITPVAITSVRYGSVKPYLTNNGCGAKGGY